MVEYIKNAAAALTLFVAGFAGHEAGLYNLALDMVLDQPRYDSVYNTNQGRDWSSNYFDVVVQNDHPVRHKVGIHKWGCDDRIEIACIEETKTNAVIMGGEDKAVAPGEVCTVTQGSTLKLVSTNGKRVLVELITGADTGKPSSSRCPWGTQFFVDRDYYNNLIPTRAAFAKELSATS